MQDRKALQAGTSHNLGQNFSRAFNMEYLGRDNKLHLCWTTSWGVSTRLIGALIMTHSDDEGLVLPPRCAPVVVAVVPITKKNKGEEEVHAACRQLLVSLCGEERVVAAEARSGSREILSVFINDQARQQVVFDMRDMRPVDKHFYWEQRGVPFRMELGPRDVEKGSFVLKQRLSREKEFLNLSEPSPAWLKEKMEAMQAELLRRAVEFREQHTTDVNTYEELKKALADRVGFVRCWFNQSKEAEAKIKEETKGTVRLIPFEQPEGGGTCVYSGEPATEQVIFATSY